MISPVTQKGSITLFYYIKSKLAEISREKVSNKKLSTLLNFNYVAISNWKHGRRLVTDISTYVHLARLIDTPIDYLYSIACEDVFPIECNDYIIAINKNSKNVLNSERKKVS